MNPRHLMRGRLSEIRWGDWSFLSLCISVLSGIIVGLQYDPSTPFYSTASIDTLVPFGSYFRSLHFYSSQLFFLTAVAHFISVFNDTDNYSDRKRISLVLTLPVILMLLFTGYILRGDSTGSSAGVIAENILLSVPLVGNILNATLFSISEHGMQRVYLHHVITFDILFLVLAWEHLRRYKVKLSSYPLFIVAVLSFSVFINAPIDPESLGVFYITGPWFFLGLQELLRYLHPLIAGILVPFLFVFVLASLSKTSAHFRKFLLFIVFWMLAYLFFTLLALYTHG